MSRDLPQLSLNPRGVAQMDQIDIQAKARELETKFNSQWGPFTRSLAGHPKTALAIGVGAGLAIGTSAGQWLIEMLLSLAL